MKMKISPDIENSDLYKRFVNAGYRLVKKGEGYWVYLGDEFLLFYLGDDAGLKESLESVLRGGGMGKEEIVDGMYIDRSGKRGCYAETQYSIIECCGEFSVEYCACSRSVHLLGVFGTLKEAKECLGPGIVPRYINEDENPVYPGEEGYGK